MTSTNPIIRCTWAALAALLSTACQGKPTPTQPVQEASAPVASSNACQPIAELSALDPRRPVPLQPMMAWHQKQNMQQHLEAIQGIVDGLAQEDWKAIGLASARIESSPQMQQMCEHMGAGAEGFTELALDFHHRADAIGEAARAQDAQAVLRATSNTLQACTSCHAKFRQQVVDAETWMARTGQAHDPAMMHGGH
ncbi:MAG: cytochrome c [Polyangiales bacterium]